MSGIDLEEAVPEGQEGTEEEFGSSLQILDQSIGFLLLIIAATLLSFYALIIQRKQLIAAREDPECLTALPEIYPIRKVASSIIVGALCYFYQLSVQTLAAALPEDQAARRSAGNNHAASLLVLAAALIRYWDLNEVECERNDLLEKAPKPGEQNAQGESP